MLISRMSFSHLSSLVLTLAWAGFLSVLFSGCSSKIQQAQISTKNKEAIKTLLPNRPNELQIAFEEELTAVKEQTEDKNLTTEEALALLLSHTKNKLLSSDESFEEIRQITADRSLESTDIYASLLAGYMSDDKFLCKEPVYYDYFNKRYHSDAKAKVCDQAMPFKVLSKQGKEKIVWLDPQRVSGIHILFAGEGEALMSQYGHLSMRLIVCPKDDFSEEACNSNLYEHIVLGYRAHVNELKIDTIKGLMGDYRAYLFANDFMDIYQEYAISEFRNLYSLPLMLDKQSREHLVRAMSQIHWNYSGDYKFLTQNCSTLMQKSLTKLWERFGHESGIDELYWRPDNFFAQIRQSPLTDQDVLNDLDQAEQQGYYFPSTGPVYQKALNVVREAMSKPYFTDLENYINTNPKERYANVLADKSYFERLKGDDYLREAQLLLEELSLLRFEARMMAELSYYFQENELTDVTSHMETELDTRAYDVFKDCVLEPVIELSRPVKKTRGVPTFLELSSSDPKSKKCDPQKDQDHILRINEELERLDPKNMATFNRARYFWIESLNNITELITLKQE